MGTEEDTGAGNLEEGTVMVYRVIYFATNIILWKIHFARVVCGKYVCVRTHDNLNVEPVLWLQGSVFER